MPVAEEIYLDQKGSLTRAAFLVGGQVSDLFYETANTDARVGDVYRGKVSRVIPSMQAAFIELGLPLKGFLHVRNLSQWGSKESPSKPKIEKLIHEGQMLLVQVSKPTRIGDNSQKGPTLTTEISFSDSSLVYLPTAVTSDVVVSKKIAEHTDAALMKSQLEQVMHEQGLQGRVIIRSEVIGGPDDLEGSLLALNQRWQGVLSKAKLLTNPGLVAPEQGLLEKSIQQLSANTKQLWLAGDATINLAKAILKDQSVDPRISLSENEETQKIKAIVDQAEKEALSRRVALPSGGSLVFDATEALTVVDVNSGSTEKGAGTYHLTNLEAAAEIARQLRLRNIGGIIVVDFINTEVASNKVELLEALSQSLSLDRVKTHCEGNSSLGLIAITRARKQANISDLFTHTCPNCDGEGRVKKTEIAA